MKFRQLQADARAQTRRLLALFALAVVLLVVLVNGLLGLGWFVATGGSTQFPTLFFETNTAVVLLFVIGGALVETLRLKAGGGRHVAAWAGGREIVEPRDLDEKRLRNVADELSIASGQPRMPVFVMDKEEAINGFAAGWQASDAVVVVTRGALERLSRDELQGLVAHEFAHVEQGDLRRNMVLLALVWGLSLVYGYGRSLVEEDDDGRRGLGAVVGIVFLGAGWLGWVAGQLLHAAVSREREFAADAGAVRFTRSRDGIGRALRKIWHQQGEGAARMRDQRAGMLGSLFVSAPPGWLRLHPAMKTRVQRIYGRAVGPLAAERVRPVSIETAAMADTASPGRVAAFGAGPDPGLGASGRPTGSVSDRGPANVRPRAGSGSGSGSGTFGQPGEGPRPALPATGHLGPMHRRNTVPADLSAARASSRASSFGGIEEDREAMGRLGLLHGPLERRTAVLALLLPEQPRGPALPGRPTERLAAWRRECSALPSADRVLADVQSLSAAARLPWFETLLERTRSAPRHEHGLLRESAHRVLAAGGGPDALERIELEVLDRRLGDVMAPRLKAADTVTELSELDAASVAKVAAITALLDELVPERWHWYDTVMLEWDERRHVARSRPDDAALRDAFTGLRGLPWMLRPLLIRLWVAAANAHGPAAGWPRGFLDGFRLASLALDCPLHPDVEQAYIDL